MDNDEYTRCEHYNNGNCLSSYELKNEISTIRTGVNGDIIPTLYGKPLEYYLSLENENERLKENICVEDCYYKTEKEKLAKVYIEAEKENEQLTQKLEKARETLKKSAELIKKGFDCEQTQTIEQSFDAWLEAQKNCEQTLKEVEDNK